MFKLFIAIKKEFLILIYDKAGLVVMFAMPILLVFVITIVQDSAFRIVNENRISMLIVNQDTGVQSKKLIKLMSESGLFRLEQGSISTKNSFKETLLKKDFLTGLYIPSDFSEKLIAKANLVSAGMMDELGLDRDLNTSENINFSDIEFFHDPVLQENYCLSVINMIDAFLKGMEGELFIKTMCDRLELKESPQKLKDAMINNIIPIKRKAVTASDSNVLPNSTQHNVPAWTIFAMFFMVVSLGNNIVKERLNGSFIRLKTMPSSFILILASKMFVYLSAALLQVCIIFSLAKLTFPLLGLPELTMPLNWLGFLLVVLLSSFAAVSYAMLVGSFAKTQEQSYGFGAISIVIFAAIGGIWVPSFVMPDYMQFISVVSPLNWCLEGFYVLFLKGGVWGELQPVVLGLFIFIISCLSLVYLKLKKEKIV